MFELFKLFFDICRFKKAPQDVPGSNVLLRFLIALYACVSFLNLVLSSDALSAAIQVLIEILLILSLTWTILLMTQRSTRFQQTVCALMGTDTLISFFALPAIATLVIQGSSLSFIAIVFLMLWHWVVSAHIFSHALNQPFIFGLGVSFMYILTSYQIISMIFPEIILN